MVFFGGGPFYMGWASQVALTVSQATTDVVASCHHYFSPRLGKGGRGIGGAGSPDVFHGSQYN